MEEIKSKKKYNGEDTKSTTSNTQIGATISQIQSTTTKTTTTSTGVGVSSQGSRIRTLMFDYSVENHLKCMDSIYKLCGESGIDFLVDVEIQRLASSISFLSEWRYFIYTPRSIRFVSETGRSNETEASNEITLSQFSAAMVPKCDMEGEKGANAMQSRKDFALYVGGLVWSLDWCPKTNQVMDSDTRCEFIAVAAHPPDSTNHMIGAPLSGRGMIQIWCVLNTITKEDMPAPVGSTKRSYHKKKVAKKVENKPVRPKGRPRKNPLVGTPVPNPKGQITQALVVQVSETTSEATPADESVLCIPTSQEILAPIDKIGAEGSSKQQKLGRKARKNSKTKIPVEDTVGQFVPALAVRLPEGASSVLPADQNLLHDPVPKEPKQRKRKAIYEDKVITDDSAGIPNYEGKSFQVLAIEFPESTKNNSPAADDLQITQEPLKNTAKRRMGKRELETDMDCTLAVFRRRFRKKSKPCNNLEHENSGLQTPNLDEGPSVASVEENFLHDLLISEANVSKSCSNPAFGGDHVLKDDVIPRVVLCLGHDGKVAWDVKWRPSSSDESVNKHRMGYLAVVLGNGSVEVWEIPSPQVVNCIYKSRCGKGTDPRFAKLKPLFRCSMLKYGDKQSMPLTVEWSGSPPHDLILAGCHDGVVALWKFSAEVPSEDAKPLLCFSAETGPIRSLTWAPYEGDPESSNIIVTAGHGGLKFWDLRDPFRPLWDANPSQRFIYGLDWAPDPRCLLVCYDDGTLRMLSLSRAAYDVPVTGQLFSGTHQQGLHSYYCSSFAIWSIHISRLTGMVAYCCADGTVLYFQLTNKEVDKDPLRNRSPHFLCGSLASEETVVSVNTQLPSSPQQMKKSATAWSNTPRPAQAVVSGLNQSKRTKKGTKKVQKPDDDILALSYGADTGNEAQTNAKGGKGKASEALVYVPADGENRHVNPEVPPPKILSMYRVRWNMNKGSERWLCYGGASGIVRCQEIVAPVFDKKLLKK